MYYMEQFKKDCKTIYYPRYVEAAFLICKHMLIKINNLESYNVTKTKRLKQSNFLVWTGICQAFPSNLKRLEFDENELNSRISVWEKRFNPLTRK